jgi:hypothetical protein
MEKNKDKYTSGVKFQQHLRRNQSIINIYKNIDDGGLCQAILKEITGQFHLDTFICIK